MDKRFKNSIEIHFKPSVFEIECMLVVFFLFEPKFVLVLRLTKLHDCIFNVSLTDCLLACVKIIINSIAVQKRYFIHWKCRVLFTLPLSQAKKYKV